MKTIILLILSAFTAFAATTYPVLTDNANRTFSGGATNLALLNGTNVFTGTNTFNTNLIFGSSTLQTQLDSKPTVALTNVALLNGTNNIFTGTNTFKKVKMSSVSTSATGLEVYGGSSFGTANANSGEIKLGDGATDYGLITYNNANGVLYIDNHYSSGSVVFSVAGNSLFSALSTGTKATAPSSSSYGLLITGGSSVEPSSGSAELRLGVDSTDYGSFSYGATSGNVTVKASYAPGNINFVVGTNNIANITSGGVVIGGGSAISKVITSTAVLDYDLTALVVEDKTITVTGAGEGDVVTVGAPNGSITATIQFAGWVSATNTVTIRARTSAVGENPASGTFRATVIRH